MIVTALIINTPTSPNISLESYLSPKAPQFESSSSDDESNDHLQPLTNLNDLENDTNTWHQQLAQALVSMHYDMHVIITGFDEMSDQNSEGDIRYQKAKCELMRIAVMLNPSDLPTYKTNQLTSSYVELRELNDLPIRDKPYRHEKLRQEIRRIISSLKRGMEKLRLVLFSPSYRNKSSCYVQKYRKRVANSLSDIREHMIAYNRANEIVQTEEEVTQEAELAKHQKTVYHVLSELVIKDPLIDERIADYRVKLNLTECKEKSQFISSPLILPQAESLVVENKSEDHVPFVQPSDFPDLCREANEFFDSESSSTSKLQTSADGKT